MIYLGRHGSMLIHANMKSILHLLLTWVLLLGKPCQKPYYSRTTVDQQIDCTDDNIHDMHIVSYFESRNCKMAAKSNVIDVSKSWDFQWDEARALLLLVTSASDSGAKSGDSAQSTQAPWITARHTPKKRAVSAGSSLEASLRSLFGRKLKPDCVQRMVTESN